MIDLFMALWNQKHTRTLLKVLSTFFLLGIFLSLVTLGMQRWSFKTQARMMNRSMTDDAAYLVITATPVPTKSAIRTTPTATAVRRYVYFCPIPKVVPPASAHPAAGQPATGAQHNGSSLTATPTLTATPSRASATVTPTLAALPTGTVSPTMVPPTPGVAAAPGANTATDNTYYNTNVDIGDIGITENEWNLLSRSQAPGVTPISNRSHALATAHAAEVRRSWGANCFKTLRNSLDEPANIDVTRTLVANTSIIAGGSLAGTILLYSILYLLKRRKRA
jgi:hypothetical protein